MVHCIPPYELNVFCVLTAAESRAKIWPVKYLTHSPPRPHPRWPRPLSVLGDDYVVVNSMFVVALIECGGSVGSLFCEVVLCALSNFASIL